MVTRIMPYLFTVWFVISVVQQFPPSSSWLSSSSQQQQQQQQQQRQTHTPMLASAHLLRSGSSWPTQGSLTIDELTIVSDFDQITILGDVNVVQKGILVIEGDEASLFALDMHITGLINFVFAERGPSEAVNIEGELVINVDTAKLSIDASEYSAGEGVVPLIKYSSHMGAFAPKNVMVIGLDPSLSAELVNGPDSLDMILTHNQAYKPANKDDSNRTVHTMFKQPSHQETNQRFHLLNHPEEQ